MDISLIEYRQLMRRNIIFNYIRKNNGQFSRNDLARLTKFSMTTITSLVDSLIEEELVLETESNDNRVGRRPILLSANPDSIFFAGLDCNASNVNMSVIDCLEEVIYNHTIRLETASPEALLAAIESSILMFQEREPEKWLKLDNITIGLPGKIDRQSGIGISYLSIKDWNNIDVLTFLSSKFDKRFYFINNVDAMVVGYQSSANLSKDHTTLFMILRHGVGARLYSKGMLMSDFGVLCEFGHLKARNSSRQCSCGKRGCYDAEITIPGILNKLREVASVKRLSELSAICKEDSYDFALEKFLELVKLGNTECVEIFNETSMYIGELLATIMLIFSPDQIVLSTELCRLGDTFKHSIENILDQELPPAYPSIRANIEYILPKRYLGSIGAAIIGLQEKFNTTNDII